jgi:hypothetical protein
MNSNNGIIALICVGGFVLVIGSLILFSAFQAQKRKKGFAEVVLQLGFKPLLQVDVELLALLQQMYAPSKVNKVRNLAVKPVGDERYFLFDITYTSPQYSSENSTSTTTEYNNVAIISQYLDLPPFILMTRIKAPGGLGGMADNMLVYAASRAGFTEYKETPTVFEMNYMLFVKDDPRVKTAFTEQLLSQMGMLESVVGRGEGKLLLLNRFDLRGSNKLDAVTLAEQVTLLRQVTDWLVK